jgi:hypothetical protein
LCYSQKKEKEGMQMKKFFVLIFIVLVGLLFISASVYSEGEEMRDIRELDLGVKTQDIRFKGAVKPDLNFGKLPLYFIANKGQVNQKAKFYAKASRYTLWLTGEGLVFDSVKKVKVEAEVEEGRQTTDDRRQMTEDGRQGKGKFARDVSRLIFLNAKKNPGIVPVEESKLKVNYFLGNDPSKWQCDVPTSKAVLYKNLYKNIDLKVYGIEKQIEYDWIVKAGGNPGDIRFEYKNVKGTRLDEQGNLLIETDFGELMHKRPVGYQMRKAQSAKRNAQNTGVGAGLRACPKELTCPKERKYVDVNFKKIAENTYGFEVADYDKRSELIIDPVVLAYSTYLFGGAYDYGQDIAVDSSGYAYVTGYTNGATFPTLNQFQTYQGNYDVFITKIDTTASGASSLIYSTFLGGSSEDRGFGIAVDGSGNAYVTGYTDSTDFPTLNQFQTYQGNYDVFVARIDTTRSGASSLIYSTYLGGADNEHGYGIAADSSGNAYVTGDTWSSNFPILDQFQTDQPSIDAFVSKIDTTESGASSLIYSTYLGGSSSDHAYGIAVDGNGEAYVAGRTFSNDFPTLNQYQGDQPDYDAFVTRIDTNRNGASSLIYSTYLGGTGTDSGGDIAIDSSGNTYVAGYTMSGNFPTLNQYQLNQPDMDVFVAKIDTTQAGTSGLLYSTYLGGSGEDRSFGIAVDSSENAYVIGWTTSVNFPTLNQYQTDPGDNTYDAFVTKLDSTGSGISSLIYSTYLGGEDMDGGLGIAVDSSGNAYAAGWTKSTDFPTLNQYQGDQPGYDVFVTKLNAFPITVPTVITTAVSSVTPFSASGGGNVTSDGGAAVTARGVCWSTSPNPTTADNHTTDGTGTGVFTSSITGLTPGITYYVRAYATNAIGTAYGNQVTFTTPAFVNPIISGTVSDGANPIEGVSINFSHDGHTETTGADGYYSYEIPSGTSTVVTASKPGYIFTPPQYSYTNLTVDQPNQDFTVLYSIFVIITNPHDGDMVSKNVMITAEVSVSNQLAEKVEFYIDGVLVKQDKRPPYKHLWNTTRVPDGSHTIKAKAYHSSGLTHQHQITVNVYNSTGPSHIELNRKWLNFGDVIGNSRTGSQRFLISNSGGGTLDWTASVSAAWIQVSPLSGTADMIVMVSIDAAGLTTGSYTGTISISDPNADNSPAVLYIYLEVKEKPQESSPFGSFDSPVDGAVVSGSIPITGWALDDVEVSSVKVFRNPLEGHETGQIYIGDAVFVDDARPDVEGKYPTYPNQYRAGWGYMMLSNVLPIEGNGTFVITAVALDSSGNEVTLGEKTIICDNANAVKPFGAIDTPFQGGDAAGAEFINFGWALTPKPNSIKKNGSTIKVWVDGVPLEGNPEYNQYRKDVADLFPTYNNSGGAGGFYYLDTTLYTNGVHTIAWSVTDNAGNTDGIGSRYFNVMNINNPAAASISGFNNGWGYQDRFSIDHLPAAASPVYLKKGYKISKDQNLYYPGNDGIITIEIKEGERIEIQNTTSGYYCGYMVVDDQLKPLPVGSFLDTEGGVFYWQVGVGFIGKYRLVFIEKSENRKFKRKYIDVMIHPK